MKIFLSLFVYLLFNNGIAQESEKLKGSVIDYPDNNPIDSVIVEVPNSDDFSTRYYLKIVRPDSTIDYKILVVKPDPTIDYKILELKNNSKLDVEIDVPIPKK